MFYNPLSIIRWSADHTKKDRKYEKMMILCRVEKNTTIVGFFHAAYLVYIDEVSKLSVINRLLVVNWERKNVHVCL